MPSQEIGKTFHSVIHSIAGLLLPSQSGNIYPTHKDRLRLDNSYISFIYNTIPHISLMARQLLL
jgi:hypothetical protein